MCMITIIKSENVIFKIIMIVWGRDIQVEENMNSTFYHHNLEKDRIRYFNGDV